MNDTIDYSILIRTTGKAGEKYSELLLSIKKLNPPPQEVIVVLPEGCDIPKERLGCEKFLFTERGMVSQRLAGLNACGSKYALFCDDDIRFPEDFVRLLYKPLHEGKARLSSGPLVSFFPEKGMVTFISAILSSAVPMIFQRDDYVHILRSTGYSYNREISTDKEFYFTQSAAWTCFFGETEAVRNIELDREIWLDSHGYSALDDQTMFYKGYLRGIYTVIVPKATYEHLDAHTSTKGNRNNVLYSRTFNRIVFWHRFIFLMQKSILGRTWARACFFWYRNTHRAYDFFNMLRGRLSLQELQMKRKASRDAWKYISSNEYKKLPPIGNN